MASRDLVPFGLVRVDDRLLHGQVVLNWVRWLRPAVVAVVDDGAADDAPQRAILQSVAPREAELWLGSVAEAASGLPCRDPQRVLLLVRDVDTATRLFGAGVRYARLNLGCVGLAPGRRRVSAQVALSVAELEALRSLEGSGVVVTLQAVPSERALRLCQVRWRERRP